jgi:hypothetical protein
VRRGCSAQTSGVFTVHELRDGADSAWWRSNILTTRLSVRVSPLRGPWMSNDRTGYDVCLVSTCACIPVDCTDWPQWRGQRSLLAAQLRAGCKDNHPAGYCHGTTSRASAMRGKLSSCASSGASLAAASTLLAHSYQTSSPATSGFAFLPQLLPMLTSQRVSLALRWGGTPFVVPFEQANHPHA